MYRKRSMRPRTPGRKLSIVVREKSYEAAETRMVVWCREPESNRHAIASAGF
jgi:hypothetical protein